MKKILLASVVMLLLFSLISIGHFSFFSKDYRAEVTNEIDTIELDLAGANATILTKNQDYVEAKLKGKGKVSLSKKDDTIEIEYDRRWYEFFNFGDRTELIITIPENYNRDLEFDVRSGNINFELSKDMELHEFKMDVRSGNIRIDSLQANKAELDVNSGNVNIKHVTGQLEIDVSSGNISIQVDDLIGDIDAEVSSGHIALDLPDDSDFTLSGEISSGNIHNRFPLNNEVREKNRLRGTHGTGQYNIDLEVSSGSIEIK